MIKWWIIDKCQNFFLLDLKHLTVWTSQLQRTESTAVFVNATERKRFSSLNEIEAGNFDGLSYEDIEELYPEEFEKRLEDKLGYRYPGGKKWHLENRLHWYFFNPWLNVFPNWRNIISQLFFQVSPT